MATDISLDMDLIMIGAGTPNLDDMDLAINVIKDRAELSKPPVASKHKGLNIHSLLYISAEYLSYLAIAALSAATNDSLEAALISPEYGETTVISKA